MPWSLPIDLVSKLYWVPNLFLMTWRKNPDLFLWAALLQGFEGKWRDGLFALEVAHLCRYTWGFSVSFFMMVHSPFFLWCNVWCCISSFTCDVWFALGDCPMILGPLIYTVWNLDVSRSMPWTAHLLISGKFYLFFRIFGSSSVSWSRVCEL